MAAQLFCRPAPKVGLDGSTRKAVGTLGILAITSGGDFVWKGFISCTSSGTFFVQSYSHLAYLDYGGATIIS